MSKKKTYWAAFSKRGALMEQEIAFFVDHDMYSGNPISRDLIVPCIFKTKRDALKRYDFEDLRKVTITEVKK